MLASASIQFSWQHNHYKCIFFSYLILQIATNKTRFFECEGGIEWRSRRNAALQNSWHTGQVVFLILSDGCISAFGGSPQCSEWRLKFKSASLLFVRALKCTCIIECMCVWEAGWFCLHWKMRRKPQEGLFTAQGFFSLYATLFVA